MEVLFEKVGLSKFSVCVNNNITDEVWNIIWKKNTKIPTALQRDDTYYNTAKIVETTLVKTFFYRDVELGRKERVVVYYVDGKVRGEIARNTTPFYYDDWENQATFVSKEQFTPPKLGSL